MARSAGLAIGVIEVVARRSPTAVQGRCRLQGLDPIGFVIYSVAFYGSVASCFIVNRITYRTDNDNNNSSSSKTAAAPQTNGTSEVLDAVQGPRESAARTEKLTRMRARAQRAIDATGKKFFLESHCCCEKVGQTPRITVTRIAVILVNNSCERYTAVLRCCPRPSTILVEPP